MWQILLFDLMLLQVADELAIHFSCIFIGAAPFCSNNQPEVQKFLFKARIPADCKQSIRDELEKKWGIIRAAMYIDENPARQDLIKEINKTIYGV